MQGDPRDRSVAAYYRVRQMLGGLGVALPFLMIVTGLLAEGTLRPSMSDYYHALQRDIFVGCLFAIGTFLIAYRGHDRAPGETLSDEIITNLAGIGAICIALFPSEVRALPPGASAAEPITLMQAYFGVGNAVIGHYLAAQVFLYSLAWMCFVHFGRSGRPARRRIYRACGLFIVGAGLVATLAALARHLGPPEAAAFVIDKSIVFWCEAVGVWAFGIAWLVKGRAEMLLTGRRPPA